MNASEWTVDRRDFLKQIGAGLASAGVLAIFGCEEVDLNNAQTASATNAPPDTLTAPTGNTNSPSGGPTTHSDKAGNISNNHGHTVTLTAAQQDAGQGVKLTLTLGSGHTHTLELSAGQVQSAGAGNGASGTSSVDFGHSHQVTF